MNATESAIARVEKFLRERAEATSVDPEVLASHNGRELRASDLWTLLSALRDGEGPS